MTEKLMLLLKQRKTRHTSVAMEMAEAEFDAAEAALNLACDWLEAHGHAEAAQALSLAVFGVGEAPPP